MGRTRKYKNAAEKQRAWRIRTGKQKEKVSLALRRGERLGSRESFREKKEGETWEEYGKHIQACVASTRIESAKGRIPLSKDKAGSLDRGVLSRRAYATYEEPTMGEEYYERQYQREKDLTKDGRKIKRRKPK